MIHPLLSAKVFFILSVYVGSTYAARILCIYHTGGKSHYMFASPLLKELAKRGHDVTVYTLYVDSKYKNIPNYTQVDVSTCHGSPQMQEFSNIDFAYSAWSTNIVKTALQIPTLRSVTIESFERCSPLVDLLKSTQKYHLFITETFFSDAMLMFANKFDVPFVVTIPNALLPFHTTRVATAANPSYVQTLGAATAMGYSSPMTFLQRVRNTVAYVIMVALYYSVTMRSENEVVRHFLGSGAPSLYETVKNASLILSNSDSNLTPTQPLVPGIVQVAGMHIDKPKSLPKDIESFINKSTHGVIYFCMGSALRSESFQQDKRDALLRAFTKLRQRVLWKWENDSLTVGKSDQIMIAKWMPQRDILAHPNVKLFISHGGLLGTSEAVYEGVPILGIPIFGDQKANLRNIEQNGAGEILEYPEISEETVYEKAYKLLNDPRYKKNAADLSARYRDRPMSPLDTAVYWTEYVIRHRGAPHVRTAAVHMPWYQYLLLDVIAFLIFLAVIAFASVYCTARLIYRLLVRPNVKVKVN